MLESLNKYCESFHLFIYAFDQIAYDILKQVDDSSITILSLNDFENDELLAVKGDRTVGEYCWTCTPAIIKHSIETFSLDSCTYLDADICFFADPQILINEVIQAGKDVLITPHNYSWLYDQSTNCGKYCVQFVYFSNTRSGMEVLTSWYSQCLEWCYDRFEFNRFGDQKYLDLWPTEYPCVHVLKNQGGIAPWNVNTTNIRDIVFYHFHGLKQIENGRILRVGYAGYTLPVKVNKYYRLYENALQQTERHLLDNFNFKMSYAQKMYFWVVVKSSVRRLFYKILFLFKK